MKMFQYSKSFGKAALSALLLTGTAYAGIVTEDMVLSVNLEVPERQVFITLMNASESTNLADFDLQPSEDVVSFNDLKATVGCGRHQSLDDIWVWRWKTYIDKEKTQVWMGTGGPQALHDYNIGQYYSGVGYPALLPQVWEYENPHRQRSYQIFHRGNRFSLNIPYSRLRNPQDGSSPAIDGQTVFNKALQDHVDNGGNYVDFFRQDHTFVVDVPLTLGTACRSQKQPLPPDAPEWLYFRYFEFAEEMVQIVYEYEGDPTLELHPVVPIGGDGDLQNKILVDDLSIIVDPVKSTGVCPRVATATANVVFDRTSPSTRRLRYRFLQDGKPVTSWQEQEFINRESLTLTHDITVTNPPQKGKGAIITDVKFAPDDDLGTIEEPTIQQKPVVGIEISFEGQSRLAAAQYEAYCSEPVEMTLDPDAFDDPDLVPRGELQIGSVSADWGMSMTLSMDDVLSVTSRGCRFRSVYQVLNAGETDAGTFKARLTRPGAVLNTNSVSGLDARDTTTLLGKVTLPGGVHNIVGSVDFKKQVSESDESNNTASVTVIVPNECGSSDPVPQ